MTELETPTLTAQPAITPDSYVANYNEFGKDWMSTSALSLLMLCGHAFYLKYILKIREPIGIRMTAGTGAHKGREINLKQKIESKTDLAVNQVTDAARDSVNQRFSENEVSVEVEFEGKNNDQARGIAVDLAVSVAEVDREIFQPEIMPVAVEKSYAIEYPGLSRIIVGTLDAEEDDDVVRDLKSGKRAYGQAKADDSMALSTYGMLKLASVGRAPKRYMVDNVVCPGGSKPKTNAYQTTRSLEQLNRQLRRFASWLKVVDSGMFAPCNPESYRCSPDWCGYWKMCPYGGGK